MVLIASMVTTAGLVKQGLLLGYSHSAMLTYTVLFLFAIYSVIHAEFIRTIFSFEQKLWIDASFKQKNISGMESWAIARKIFWPVIRFRLFLFYKYYLLPVVIYFGLIAILIITAANNLLWPWWFFPIVLFGGPILIWIYDRYYMGLKTKYAWFLFVDMYCPDNFTYKSLFSELNKLNNVDKKSANKTAIKMLAGVDFLSLGTDMTSSVVTNTVASAGELGKMIAAISRPLLQESAATINDFTQLVGFYILYDSALKLLYGDTPRINNYIYSLK